MLEQINALIESNHMCVLATSGVQGPHTSLMTYVYDIQNRSVHMITPKDTLKYRNLIHNPLVSLLVDTRCQQGRGNVQAVTIAGECREILDKANAEAIQDRIVGQHPHLRVLAQAGEVAVLAVIIKSLQLLNGPREVHYVRP